MIFSSANQFKAKVEYRTGHDHVIIIQALTSQNTLTTANELGISMWPTLPLRTKLRKQLIQIDVSLKIRMDRRYQSSD